MSLKGSYIYTKMIKRTDQTRGRFHEAEQALAKNVKLPQGEFQECSSFLFSVVTAWCSQVTYTSYDCLYLLAFGFVRTGTFPSIGLPLFVQPADTHSLPATHGNVLLHKAGQHAFLGQH